MLENDVVSAPFFYFIFFCSICSSDLLIWSDQSAQSDFCLSFFIWLFVLNRVEEVKSTYIEIAAYPAESFLFLTNLTSQIRQFLLNWRFWRCQFCQLRRITAVASSRTLFERLHSSSIQSKRLQMHLIHDAFQIPARSHRLARFCRSRNESS